MKLLGISLMTGLLLASSVIAEESNQREVRRSISNGGWHVFYGEKITEAEYAGVTVAWALAIATENPGPILAYMEEYVNRTVARIKRQLPDMAESAIRDLIERAITTEGGRVRLPQIDVKFGIATYNRWERIVYHEPRTRCGRWGVPEVYMCRVERRVPLPNWHDLYVAFRVR